VFIHTEIPNCPYQLLGSATAVRLGDRHWILCCGHQIDAASPDMVAIYSWNTQEMIGGSRLNRWIVTEENKDTDYIDIRAIEYIIANYGIANLSYEFFPLSPSTVWPFQAAEDFIVFGFPTELRDLDYEIPHIHMRCVYAQGKYDGTTS